MASQPVRVLEHVAEVQHGVRVGKIVALTSDGRPLVHFDGAPAKGCIARVAAASDGLNEETCIGAAVLLAFENGDAELPIIIGFVRATLAMPPPNASVEIAGERGKNFVLNGKTLVFEGQDEIVLRCGLGSLTIRADGQVIVKGTRLVSKASETNKIRGASVLIN